MDVRTANTLLIASALLLSACSDGAFATFNDLPGASILEPQDGSTVREGLPVQVRGFVDDNRTPAADLLVVWTSSIDGLLYEGPPEDDGITRMILEDLDVGVHDLTLRVVDPRGGEDVDRISLEVIANQAPTAQIANPTATGTYHSNVPVTLVGEVADVETELGLLVIDWVVDGELLVEAGNPDDAGNTNEVYLFSEGAHTVELRVMDDEGKSSSAEVAFSVGGPNNPPTCSLDLPTEGAQYTQGDEVLFVGTALDADIPASQLTVEWSSSVDGPLGVSQPSDSGAVTFPTTQISGGTPTITMTVFDQVGASCTDSVQLVVASPPSVTILSPVNGSTVPLGVAVDLDSVVSDVQSAPNQLTIAWSSDLDGFLGNDVADASGLQEGAWGAFSAGTHTLSVTVTDPGGLSTVGTTTFTVSAPPTAPTVEINPNPAGSTQNLVTSIVTPSTDPEGDPVTYSYAWARDGVPFANASDTLASSATSRGEVWTVTVTPNDGWSSGPPGVATVTILNGAPSASAPILSPSLLYTNSTATCVSNGTDPDNDPVTLSYTWLVNGSDPGVFGPQLTGGSFARGDTIQCFATPDDGTAVGPTVASTTATVLNSVPTAPSVVITPAAPSPDDTLTCALTVPSTDADNDPLTHDWVWYQNGNLTAITTQEVDASLTADQDVWTCEVTATDGIATSPLATDTVSLCADGAWYEDLDGDGYGQTNTEILSCTSPGAGWVSDGGDCDDTDATIYPTAGDVAGDGFDADCDGMDCEAGLFNNVYFTFCDSNGDWFDAETACMAAGYDGLATLTSAAEETWLVGLMINSGGSNQDPWLGMTDQGGAGTFVWTDGSPISYQNWGTGQPDSGGTGNDCVVLTVSGQGNASWDDVSCAQGSPGWTSFACSLR